MREKDCDGKRCDENAVPCDFAKQVIFGLNCDLNDLKEQLKVQREERFIGGVLVALQIVHQFDQRVMASEIVKAVGGLKLVEGHAKKSGNKCDIETINWVKG